MRSALRWLILLIPTLLFLLVLGRIANLDTLAVQQYIPKVPNVSDLSSGLSNTFSRPNAASKSLLGSPSEAINITYEPGSRDPIYKLWRQWSKVIHEQRPKAARIALRSQAGTQKPSDKSTERKPYSNLVKNAKIDLEAMAASHKAFIQELKKYVPNEDVFKGRGVVAVGGGEYYGPAVIGIYMLRRSGSQLPVEIFVPDETEYNAELCESYLPRLNARCVILSDFISQAGAEAGDLKLSHYQYKALALLFSSFSQVLLLDSDSMALVDPDKELFETQPFTSTGLVIWPDFWASTESAHFYTIAGLSQFPSNLPPTSSETGQVLINKETHLKTLLLVVYYNVYGPDYYYPLLSQGALGQGDKETFMAAAVVLGTPYWRIKKGVDHIGRNTGTETKGTAMIQYHAYDDWLTASRPTSALNKVRPAFLHSNTPKMNAGHLIDEGDLKTVDGSTRLRLLGSEKDQMARFGVDLEQAIWELLVQTGCELADVIEEWKKRENMCERLHEHFTSVFG